MAAKAPNLAEDRLRARQILKVLRRAYPDAECSLTFDTPYQLLVATVLSAQCTDERVNLVTPRLFAKFPTAAAMAKSSLGEIEALIQSTGFYRNKAKSILETSQAIVERYGGEVPRDLEALVALRGVGRKTANVVLGVAYGIPGMVVDTHIGRISRRLGFTRQLDPVKVEFELMDVIPKPDWIAYGHLLIHHGRAICTARRAFCEDCPVFSLCKRVGVP